MAADLLGLFEAHGLKAAKKTAGEWAAPCPACGGTDRCMIKPADPRLDPCRVAGGVASRTFAAWTAA